MLHTVVAAILAVALLPVAALEAQEPARIELDRLALFPATFGAGQRGARLEVELTNRGGGTATRVAARLEFPGRAADFSASASTSNTATLAASASAILTFSIDVSGTAAPGFASVAAIVSATDAASGRPAMVVGTVPLATRVRRPPTFEVTQVVGLRRRVSQGQQTGAAVDVVLGSSDAWGAGPPAGPPARSGAATAFDFTRDRVVLFGGSAANGLLADTWEWDGRAWREVATGNSPPARTGHAMAFDPVRRRVLLFGGTSGGSVLADTWEYDGLDWTPAPSATTPPGRSGHALAGSPKSGGVVLFGGTGDSGLLRDTWLHSSSGWSSVDSASVTSDTTPPEPRAGHAMAFDPRRESVLLYGGTTGQGAQADTWEFDGSVWQRSELESPPGPRTGFALAADAVARGVLLFGGRGPDGRLSNDLWLWTGQEWMERPPSGDTSEGSPAPRSGASLVFDELTSRALVFGGSGDGPVALGDTWLRASQPAGSGVTVSIRFEGDEAGHTVTASPRNSPVLVHGEFLTYTFDVRVGGAALTGPRVIAADALVFDAETGVAATVTTGPAGQWIVETPAALDVTAIRLSPAVAAPGDRGVVVEVSVDNTGPETFRAGVVDLTAGLSFNGSLLGFRVTPSPSNPLALSAGASETLSYSVDLDSNTPPGTYTIAALVAGVDANTGQSAAVTGAPSAQLRVERRPGLLAGPLSFAPSSAVLGQRGVLASLTLSNRATESARPLEAVTATLDFGAAGGAFLVSPARATVQTVAIGESVVVTFLVDVGEAAPAGPIEVAALVSARDATTGGEAAIEGNARAILNVLTPAALEITDIAVPPVSSIGQTGVDVRVALRNPGLPGRGAPVDRLAVGLAFNESQAGFTVTTVVSNESSLAAGATAVLTFSVNVGDDAPRGTVRLTALASARDAISGLPATVTNEVFAETLVRPPASLLLTGIGISPASAGQGQAGVKIEVLVTNTQPRDGGAAASNLTALLTFGENVPGFAVTAAGQNARRIAAGDSAVLTFTVDVAASVPVGTYPVRAALSARDSGTGVPAVVAGDAFGTLEITESSRLEVLPVAPPGSVAAGSSFLLTATVTNRSPSAVAISGVALTFDNPFVRAVVTRGIGSGLQAGQSATIELRVSVAADAATGPVRGTLTVATGAGEGAPGSAAIVLQILGGPPAPEPRPPVARIHSESSISGGPRLLVLDALQTRDPDGDTELTYSWLLERAPASAELVDVTSATLTYDAFVPGEYEFVLTARDPSGQAGTVRAVFLVIDLPPVADAGPDRTVVLARASTGPTPGATSSIGLDASGSRDPNRTPIAYRWTVLAAPDRDAATADSTEAAAFSSRTDGSPRVTFATGTIDPFDPASPLEAAGAYEFRLAVSDALSTSTDTVRIVALDPTVLPPTADAGLDRVVEVTFGPDGLTAGTIPDPVRPGERAASIRLDGRESADPGGRALTYAWRVLERPEASRLTVLSGGTTATPTFRPDAAGRYEFELSVTNGRVRGASARVSILVEAAGANRAPSAIAVARNPSAGTATSLSSPVLEVETGTRALLDATESTDADAADRGLLAFSWSQVSGRSVSLEPSETASQVTFVPREPGKMAFRLRVTDRSGANDEAVVRVRARARGETASPRLELAATAAGRPAGEALPESGFTLGQSRSLRVTAPATVTLTGRLEGGASPAGRLFEHRWRQLSGPTVLLRAAGEAATASRESVASFEPTTSRVHEFELTVTPVDGALRQGFLAVSRRIRVIVDTALARVPLAAPAADRHTLSRDDGLAARTSSLDGSASQGSGLPGTLLFHWRQVSGPLGTIADPFSATTPFVAPDLGDDPFEREFLLELTVDVFPPGDRSEPSYLRIVRPGAAAAQPPGGGVAAAFGGGGGGCALGGSRGPVWLELLTLLCPIAWVLRRRGQPSQ